MVTLIAHQRIGHWAHDGHIRHEKSGKHQMAHEYYDNHSLYEEGSFTKLFIRFPTGQLGLYLQLCEAYLCQQFLQMGLIPSMFLQQIVLQLHLAPRILRGSA